MGEAIDAALDQRLVNRLQALAVRLHDDTAAAAAPYQRRAASHPEALSALLNFADGERADTLQVALGLSQPGVAHVVAKLERAQLVKRRPDPRDRRASLLHLTPSGRRLARQMVADRLAAVAALVEPLHPHEQAALLGAVDRMLDRATTSTDHARRTCRACEPHACDHPSTCPVTAGADRARARGEQTSTSGSAG
jgi:DNA-binding MarR family transcriptional regulator